MVVIPVYGNYVFGHTFSDFLRDVAVLINAVVIVAVVPASYEHVGPHKNVVIKFLCDFRNLCKMSCDNGA